MQQFNRIWTEKYAPNNCLLVYATGRSFKKYEMLLDEWDMMQPDILVSQDGVNIHWYSQSLIESVAAHSDTDYHSESDGVCTDGNGHFMWNDTSWRKQLQKGWDKELTQQIHDGI